VKNRHLGLLIIKIGSLIYLTSLLLMLIVSLCSAEITTKIFVYISIPSLVTIILGAILDIFSI